MARNDFIDVLQLKKESSDLCYVLKDYESKVAYFSHYKTAEAVKQVVLSSNSFKYDIKFLSRKMNKSETVLIKESTDIIDKMSHNIGMNSIRFMGYVLSKVMKRLYSHVYVNRNGIDKMRICYENSHVILLPTHRSYTDFLFLSYIMFFFDLPLPVIAAAIDFMSMKFVGELLRCCGAFFIRRSFADDDVYWTVFSHYIRSLVLIDQEPLEFFIEGTRSRTNKSLHPKIGMLGIILELWLSTNRDVTLIPISISYDRILEEKLYAWELLGVPKPKESTASLLKVRHTVFNEQYGNVYFNIGQPMSIGQLAKLHQIQRIDHNLQLRFKPILFDNEKQFLRFLSRLVVDKQQCTTIISCWSIVTLILLHYQLVECQQFVNYELLSKVFDRLTVTTASGSFCGLSVPWNNIHGTQTTAMIIDYYLKLHSGLVDRRDDTVSLKGCSQQDGDLYKGPIIRPILQLLIAERINIVSYRNPLLFHLFPGSVLLSLLKFGEVNDPVAVKFDFGTIMDIFSREFIYSDNSNSIFDSTFSKLKVFELLIDDKASDNDMYSIVRSACHSHLVAYFVYWTICYDQIVMKRKGQESKDLVKFIQSSILFWFENNCFLRYKYLEICSLDMIRNSVSKFIEVHSKNAPDMIENYVRILKRCLPEVTISLWQDAFSTTLYNDTVS